MTVVLNSSDGRDWRSVRRDGITPSVSTDGIAATISDYDLVLGSVQWSHVASFCSCEVGAPADPQAHMGSACRAEFERAVALYNSRKAALDRMLRAASKAN